MRRRCATLLTFLLLAGLVGTTVLWLRAQRRQYALSRALIAALDRFHTNDALALVNEGADCNARYITDPAPSFNQLWNQFFHRSAVHVNDSPTAFMMACGVRWSNYHGRFIPVSVEECPGLVQVMLAHGADPKLTAIGGSTTLMWAVCSNRQRTVHLLLRSETNIDARTSDGKTALLYAASLNKSLVRQLLARGADPNVADKSGETPLMLAQYDKLPNIVALLKQYGAKEPAKRP